MKKRKYSYKLYVWKNEPCYRWIENSEGFLVYHYDWDKKTYIYDGTSKLKFKYFKIPINQMSIKKLKTEDIFLMNL